MTAAKKIGAAAAPPHSVKASPASDLFLAQYADRRPPAPADPRKPFAAWLYSVDASGEVRCEAFARETLGGLLALAREWGEAPEPPPPGARVLAFMPPPPRLAGPGVLLVYRWLTEADVRRIDALPAPVMAPQLRGPLEVERRDAFLSEPGEPMPPPPRPRLPSNPIRIGERPCRTKRRPSTRPPRRRRTRARRCAG